MTSAEFEEAARMMKEGFAEIIEAAYREGFQEGFGIGLSAGHPLAGRCNEDAREDEGWEDSRVKEQHVDIIVTGE